MLKDKSMTYSKKRCFQAFCLRRLAFISCFMLALTSHGQNGLSDSDMALPVQNCEGQCLTYDDVREISVEYNGQTQRLAYSLLEFVQNTVVPEMSSFDPPFDAINSANTECVVGTYARYALGFSTDMERNGENPWMLLISHPYNDLEASPVATPSGRKLIDKGDRLPSTLQRMCYEPRDQGWISIANWNKVDPNFISGDAIRFTNANYSDPGRTSDGSEFLIEDSPTDQFLQSQSTLAILEEYLLQISRISGPNFPSPEYDAGVFTDKDILWPMIADQWVNDTNPTENKQGVVVSYFQDPVKRNALITQIVEGKLLDKQGTPIDIRGVERGSFVLDCMGNVYFHEETSDAITFSHSQVLAGGAVAAAGEFYTDEGSPTHFNVKSDHYQHPTLDFIQRMHSLFPESTFEPSFLNVDGDFAQGWNCEPVVHISAKVDGSEIGEFGPKTADMGQWRYGRQFAFRETILVKGGPAEGTLELTMGRIKEEKEIDMKRFLYVPESNNASLYVFDKCLDEKGNEIEINPAERIDYTFLELSINNGSGDGAVKLTFDNCGLECLPLEDVLSRRTDFNGVDSRYAYTFREFVRRGLDDGEFDPPLDDFFIGNSECITGYYSRFALGFSQAKEDAGEDPWMMLISHPYSHEDATPNGLPGSRRIPDKAIEFTTTLIEMCYDPVDKGWISIANWGKLEGNPGDLFNPIRLTNSNFSERGRVTREGELLIVDSPTTKFLDAPTAQDVLTDFDTRVSKLFGPNFPTPGYNNGEYNDLQILLPADWVKDSNPDENELSEEVFYFQDVVLRNKYLATIQDGVILDADGQAVDVRGSDAMSYVLDCMGRLYIRNYPDEMAIPKYLFHSQLMGGAAVAAAGELYAENGAITHINLNSNRYPIAPIDIARSTGLFPETSFEVPERNPFADFVQSWRCNTITVEALVSDETDRGKFGPTQANEDQWRFPRWMVVPAEIPVVGGNASGTLNLKTGLLSHLSTNEERLVFFTYEADGSVFKYASGSPGPLTTLPFTFVEMWVTGGFTPSRAKLVIDNCPAQTLQADVISNVEMRGNPMQAYPNPVQNWIHLTGFPDLGDLHGIEAIDMMGRKSHIDWIQTANDGSIALDVSELPTGLFLVRLLLEDDIKIFRIIKE